MTTIKAKKRDNEPVTQEVMAQAIAAGRQRGAAFARATQVRYLPQREALAIHFCDETMILLPVANYPELALLSTAELGRVELGYAGTALCLEEQDLHISLAGLAWP